MTIRDVSNSLSRIPIARIVSIGTVVIAMIGNAISSDVEVWRFAREVFILRKFFPEEMLILIALLAWIFRHTWLPFATECWNISCGEWQSGARKKLYICAFITLLGCFSFGVYGYARARYALFVDDNIQREFIKSQIYRATQLESKYQFTKAANIYEALEKVHPNETLYSSIRTRRLLISELQKYSDRLARLYEKSVSEGRDREALFLLIEQLRVSPLNENIEALLTERIRKLRGYILSMHQLDKECRAGNVYDANKYEKTIKEIVEPYALKQFVTPKDVCILLTRFQTTEATISYLESSWDIPRAEAMLVFSNDVRQGKTMQELFPKNFPSSL